MFQVFPELLGQPYVICFICVLETFSYHFEKLSGRQCVSKSSYFFSLFFFRSILVEYFELEIILVLLKTNLFISWMIVKIYRKLFRALFNNCVYIYIYMKCTSIAAGNMLIKYLSKLSISRHTNNLCIWRETKFFFLLFLKMFFDILLNVIISNWFLSDEKRNCHCHMSSVQRIMGRWWQIFVLHLMSLMAATFFFSDVKV